MMAKKKTPGVYMIKNLINFKIYFGSSDDCDARFSGHKSELRLGCHGNAMLQREWNENGETAFKFDVIVNESIKREAERIENGMIALCNTTNPRIGYNRMVNGKWSDAARLRNTERKLIAKSKYALLPGVRLDDQMEAVFIQSAKKGHHC